MCMCMCIGDDTAHDLELPDLLPAHVQGPAVRSTLDGGRRWSDVAGCDGAGAELARTRSARGPWWTAPRLPERMRAAGARATIVAA